MKRRGLLEASSFIFLVKNLITKKVRPLKLKLHYRSTYLSAIIVAILYTLYLVIKRPDIQNQLNVFLFISVLMTWFSMIGLLFYLNQLSDIYVSTIISWVAMLAASFIIIYIFGHIHIHQPIVITVCAYIYLLWIVISVDWYRYLMTSE